jgi:hypothetical protein
MMFPDKWFPEAEKPRLSPGLTKYQLDADAASSLAEIPVPSTESILANFGTSPLMRANDQPSIDPLITFPVSESTAITEFMLIRAMMLEVNNMSLPILICSFYRLPPFKFNSINSTLSVWISPQTEKKKWDQGIHVVHVVCQYTNRAVLRVQPVVISLASCEAAAVKRALKCFKLRSEYMTTG